MGEHALICRSIEKPDPNVIDPHVRETHVHDKKRSTHSGARYPVVPSTRVEI